MAWNGYGYPPPNPYGAPPPFPGQPPGMPMQAPPGFMPGMMPPPGFAPPPGMMGYPPPPMGFMSARPPGMPGLPLPPRAPLAAPTPQPQAAAAAPGAASSGAGAAVAPTPLQVVPAAGAAPGADKTAGDAVGAPPPVLAAATPGTVPPAGLVGAPTQPPVETPDWLPQNGMRPMTVYVGGFPHATEDRLVRALLTKCGPLQKWDRRKSPSDPAKRLPFAFATFVNGVGAMRALKLLDGFYLGEAEAGPRLRLATGERERLVLEEMEDALNASIRMGPAPMPMPPPKMEEAEGGDEEKASGGGDANAIAKAEQENGGQKEEEEEEDKDEEAKKQKSILEEMLKIMRGEVEVKPDPQDLVSTPGGDSGEIIAQITPDMTEEEVADELALIQEVEQHRKNQKEREERLEAERRSRLRKRVAAVMATVVRPQQAAPTALPAEPPVQPHPSPASTPSTIVAEPQLKRQAVEIKAEPVLSGATAPPVMSAQEAESSGILGRGRAQLGFGMSMAGGSSGRGPKAKISLKSGVGAFAEETEEKKRTLVKLDYTEDERLVAATPATAAAVAAAAAPPQSRAELFALPIDWAAVDANDLVKTSLRPWIASKIVEYLGQEEKSLIDFIADKVAKHTPADVLLGELKEVLDDDAEVFVTMLWRKLASHSSMLSAGAN